MITHTAYFEALASMEDEANPEWKPTLAGLVVLRLVDDWLDWGAQVVTTDVSGLRAVRDAVTAIPEENPVHAILHGLLDTLEQAELATIQSIASRLFAYSRALRYAGSWELAKDVLISIRERAEIASDREILALAALQLGPLLREMGDLEAAEQSYLLALRNAELVGDVATCVHAQMGHSKVFTARGDLPKAESMLEALILQTKTYDSTQLLGEVLQDRAQLAYLQGQYEVTIRLAYQALEYATDSISRDRTLSIIAASFVLLGHLQASRDANLILAATAQEQEIRWHAQINLMYVAMAEGHELAFEDYRLSLGRESLPPRIEAHYRLDAARGLIQFGRSDLAREELNRANELAEMYDMNQLIFEIDAVSHQQSTSRATQSTWSAETDSIAAVIGEWRQLQEHATNTKKGAVI